MHALLRSPATGNLHLKEPSSLLKEPEKRLDSLCIRLHPLLLPLHSQRHIRLHPLLLPLHCHLQPLHPWRRERHILVRRTLPLECTTASQRHRWHLIPKEPLASSSCCTRIREPTPCGYLDAAAPPPMMPA